MEQIYTTYFYDGENWRKYWLIIALIIGVAIYIGTRNKRKTFFGFWGIISLYGVLARIIFPIYSSLDMEDPMWGFDFMQYGFCKQFYLFEYADEQYFDWPIEKEYYMFTLIACCLSVLLFGISFKIFRKIWFRLLFGVAVEGAYFVKIWLQNMHWGYMLQGIDVAMMLYIFVGIVLGNIAFVITKRLWPELLIKTSENYTREK